MESGIEAARQPSASAASRCFWLAQLVLAFATGCGSLERVPQTHGQLPLGLYKVSDRQCENPSGEPDDCLQTVYIALAVGSAFGQPRDPRVIIFWFAPTEALPRYTYELRPLRQGFVDGTEYVIEDGVLW